MAKTIWFEDGTSEVLFRDSREEFARILRERLGTDAERAFLELTSAMQEQIEGYESCDLQEELDEALEDARKLNLDLQQIKSDYAGLEERNRKLEKDRDRVLHSALASGRALLDLSRRPCVEMPDEVRDIAEGLVLLQAEPDAPGGGS